MLLQAFILLFGLAILFAGGELLVRGAVRIARHFELPEAVIGLTVVAYGTSLPKLMVSLDAALNLSPDLALGNIIGSNISNVLLVLGAIAIITPLTPHSSLIRRDGVLMVAASLLLTFLCADGWLSQADGLLLLSGILLYTLYNIRAAVHETPQRRIVENTASLKDCIWCAYAYVAIGMALLITGAGIMVDAAVRMAESVGIPEAVIGLTILAIGTSMPEFLTSLIAAKRRSHDISLGNIIGGNIFNIMGILGICALTSPLLVAPSFLAFDLRVLCAVSLLCLLPFFWRKRLGRFTGALFVALFAFYTIYLYGFLPPRGL